MGNLTKEQALQIEGELIDKMSSHIKLYITVNYRHVSAELAKEQAHAVARKVLEGKTLGVALQELHEKLEVTQPLKS